MKAEKITWLDSGMEVGDGWKPIAGLMRDWKFDDMTCVSVGVLAYEDDDVVGLACTYSPGTDAYLSVSLIAKKNILNREVIIDELDQ